MTSEKKEPIGNAFCKGAIALGSGCMRCGRCAVQLAEETERLRGRIARIGLDVDRALRGEVNTESPLGTTRLQAVAALAGGPAGTGGWQHHAESMERERDHWRQRAQTMAEHQAGQAWYWQGDADDQLHSMVNSLPVVIRADQLRALAAQPLPACVTVDFAQIGSAGPFTVADGRVSLPDATMQDLVHMLRPTFEAQAGQTSADHATLLHDLDVIASTTLHATIEGSPRSRERDAVRKAIEVIRASHGQAPAGAAPLAAPAVEAMNFAKGVLWSLLNEPDRNLQQRPKRAGSVRTAIENLEAALAAAQAATTAQAAPAAGESPAFTTGDTDLDALLNETANMQRGPEHNNMDTALLWQECLEIVLARLSKAPAAGAVAGPHTSMAEAWRLSADDCEAQEGGVSEDYNKGLAEGMRQCAKDMLAAAPTPAARAAEVAMIDAAMVEMANIHPPLKRSECARLIRAALALKPDSGVQEDAALPLLIEARSALWQPANAALCERIDAALSAKGGA